MPPDLDTLFTIIGNPVRRKIIKHLSRKPSHPLQIAKDLGLGQQLIAKHLNAMEEMQLVTFQMTTSPHGPKRKTYYLSKSLTVALDIAPNLYSEHITSFNTPPSKHQISDTSSNLIGNINQIKEAPQQGKQITSFENLISHIDQEIEKLENERTILLYIRNDAMKEATKIIKELDRSEDEKKVLHCILDEHSINIADISESLNLREAKVREIMTELKKDLLTP